jgi:hypothetical protein
VPESFAGRSFIPSVLHGLSFSYHRFHNLWESGTHFQASVTWTCPGSGEEIGTLDLRNRHLVGSRVVVTPIESSINSGPLAPENYRMILKRSQPTRGGRTPQKKVANWGGGGLSETRYRLPTSLLLLTNHSGRISIIYFWQPLVKSLLGYLIAPRYYDTPQDRLIE